MLGEFDEIPADLMLVSAGIVGVAGADGQGVELMVQCTPKLQIAEPSG